jgi:hypothetical protein
LWVNGRMWTAPTERLRAGVHEVGVEVTGPSGRIGADCFLDLPLRHEPQASDYVALQPGATITRSATLFCYPPFDKPGVYVVRATYRDQNANPPPPPQGADHLLETVASAPTQFRVLPP